MSDNFLQRGAKWLFNIKPEREVVHSIDEDLVKANKTIKNLAKRLATTESELAHYKVDELDKKESGKEEELEGKIAEDLKNQESQITAEEFGRVFSLNKLFFKYFRDKKFRDKFEIADKNDETSWKFGEWLISEKGFMIITDNQGVPRAISPMISGLIHQPQSLFNQIEKRARLLLARDKDMEYIPELDEEGYADDIETTVPIWNEEEGKYEESRELRKNARVLLIEYMEKNRNQSKKIESLEMTVSELREKCEDLTRANNVLLHSNKLNKTSVSEATETITSLSMGMTDINKKIATLTESNVLLEKGINVRDGVIDKLLKKVEETGDMTAFMKARSIFEEVAEFNRLNGTNPQVNEEKPQAPAQAVPPG